MSSYCSSCGTALREGAKFCGKCGTKNEGTKPTKPVKSIRTAHISKTKVVLLAVVIIAAAVIVGSLLFFKVFQGEEIQDNTGQTNTSKFIGSWKSTVESGWINPDGSVDTYEVIWTFNDNETIRVTDSSSNVQWFNYEIKNNQLCYVDAEGVSFCMNYQFSNNNNRFTIKFGETTQVFDRIGENLSKFIGKWKYMGSSDDYSTYYTFYTNGSAKLENVYTEGTGSTDWANYLLEDSKIQIFPPGENPSSNYTYDYEFSNNDTQLVISQNGTPWIIASKIQ